jgi:hypothetical protein
MSGPSKVRGDGLVNEAQPPLVPSDLADDLRQARFAALDSRPTSEPAKRLTARIVDDVSTWEAKEHKRKYARRDERAVAFRQTLESFVGDLLLARAGVSPWVYRSMHHRAFTGERMSAADFNSAVEALEHLGLLTRIKHFAHLNRIRPHEYFAPRFRATEKLVSLAASHGIPLTEVDNHFARQITLQDPVVLRATRNTGDRLRGKKMRLPGTPKVRELEAEVSAINEFLSGFAMRGGIHRGFVRVFNNGDDPEFEWNMGGRLYSIGDDSFQQMAKRDRLGTTIDGEVVCEIDVSASYLTILYGQHRQPLPVGDNEDPYSIPGFTREVVKAWVTIQFGNPRPLTKWPSDQIRSYAEATGGRALSEDYPVRSVGAAVLERFPLLRPGAWPILMYLESTAVLRTMQALMRENVPSYPIHDSLLVPASQEALATDTFRGCYRDVCGVLPRLKVERAP